MLEQQKKSEIKEDIFKQSDDQLPSNMSDKENNKSANTITLIKEDNNQEDNKMIDEDNNEESESDSGDDNDSYKSETDSKDDSSNKDKNKDKNKKKDKNKGKDNDNDYIMKMEKNIESAHIIENIATFYYKRMEKNNNRFKLKCKIQGCNAKGYYYPLKNKNERFKLTKSHNFDGLKDAHIKLAEEKHKENLNISFAALSASLSIIKKLTDVESLRPKELEEYIIKNCSCCS